MNLFFIAIGGAIGSVARALLSNFVLRATGSLFPLGTFIVNVIGCLIFGAVIGAAQHRFVLTPETRAFLLVGILGGFTTFSAFSLDTALLIERHSFGLAAGYVVGSVAAGVSALFFGLAMFRGGHHLP